MGDGRHDDVSRRIEPGHRGPIPRNSGFDRELLDLLVCNVGFFTLLWMRYSLRVCILLEQLSWADQFWLTECLYSASSPAHPTKLVHTARTRSCPFSDANN